MIRILLIALLFASCNEKKYTDPHIIIDTQYGEIEVELYPSKAPETVASFLAHVDSGHYDKSNFYRVLKAEELPTDNNSGLIQGGLHLTGKTIVKNLIPHESTAQSGLSHTNGIISMARGDTGTASTEFFICIGDQSSLDQGRRATEDGQGMAAFGKVVNGMKIVRLIHGQKNKGDRFVKPITINSIRRL